MDTKVKDEKDRVWLCAAYPYETEIGLYVVATVLVCLLVAVAFPVILTCDGSCKRRANKNRVERHLRPHRETAEVAIEMDKIKQPGPAKPKRTVRFQDVAEALIEDKRKRGQETRDGGAEETPEELKASPSFEDKAKTSAETVNVELGVNEEGEGQESKVEVPIGTVAPFPK